MFTKIKNLILYPWHRYKEKRQIKKRLAELRKRDPFIYK